ncbi:MAG: tRNA-dihydrouridine synthase family protein [Phycisphaerales bacterium]
MLRIGPVQLKTNLLLAPIAGYCDLAFRTICREQGGLGLASTDLLSPQGLLRGTATSLDLAQTNDFDKPICMQLYGGDPAIMADGALWAVQHGATVVDINMGCPVDKVTKKDGGSKLLCIPDTAEEIVRRCAKVLEPLGIPLTCKMRLGWFDDQPIACWLAPRLIDAGVCAVTIHGRTTQQKFQGEVSHDGIAKVVEAVGNHCKAAGHAVPVIGNGDVREPQHAAEMIRRTGCAGVMIGRGAEHAVALPRRVGGDLRRADFARTHDEAEARHRSPLPDLDDPVPRRALRDGADSPAHELVRQASRTGAGPPWPPGRLQAA